MDFVFALTNSTAGRDDCLHRTTDDKNKTMSDIIMINILLYMIVTFNQPTKPTAKLTNALSHNFIPKDSFPSR